MKCNNLDLFYIFFLAPLLAALLSMVNTISTLVSDNFELTRGRVNYEATGKKNSKRVQVFLSTSSTYGIIFGVNLHRSQLVVLHLLFPRQDGSNQNCLSFTALFIQRVNHFIPRFSVKEHA